MQFPLRKCGNGEPWCQLTEAQSRDGYSKGEQRTPAVATSRVSLSQEMGNKERTGSGKAGEVSVLLREVQSLTIK